MTTPSSLNFQSLHLLADIASRDHGFTHYSSHSSSSSAGPSSDSSSSRSETSSPPSFLKNVASLHIPCSSPGPSTSSAQSFAPLKPSASSNHASPSDTNFVQFIKHKSTRKTRRTTEVELKQRMQIKLKRKQLFDKASKIKSLENSPVNERQLHVLRMVYDEITMYPCESWMVLIAIVINRAYKQVKNWFSNERQKNRSGESIPFETDDGDKVRLRAGALSLCQEWSDTFFEEVLMIYNFRVLRQSRYNNACQVS